MVALWEFALVCAPLALLSGVATGAAASSAWRTCSLRLLRMT